MNKHLIERYNVALAANPPWWRVAYLIIDPNGPYSGVFENFGAVVNGNDKAFNTLIENHVSAYLEKGTMPPAPISGAILNIAEDVAAGRTPTLRAGDYIALQTYRRAAK